MRVLIMMMREMKTHLENIIDNDLEERSIPIIMKNKQPFRSLGITTIIKAIKILLEEM